MPYNYRRNYRRKPRGRRPASRSQIYKSCGNQLWSDVKLLKRMVNVEYKFFDDQGTQNDKTATPSIGYISNILQGDGGSNRDGNQVKVIGMYINYLWVMHASAVTTQVRLMIIEDKQTNGAVFSAADILSDVTGIDNIISPYNLNNKYRFRVIYDKVHMLNDNGNQTAKVSTFIKLDTKLRYDGTAGDVTDATSSSYSFLAVSTESTNSPALTRNFWLRFVDN